MNSRTFTRVCVCVLVSESIKSPVTPSVSYVVLISLMNLRYYQDVGRERGRRRGGEEGRLYLTRPSGKLDALESRELRTREMKF